MTSTPTASLLLEKQGASDNRGSWWFNMNRALDQIDAAVSGVTTVSTTGGLTTLDDAAYTVDASKSMILAVTGILTSNATIEVPSRSKIYVVHNGTSGAYTVTIKMATGTGVPFAPGQVAIVYVDPVNDIVHSAAGGGGAWGTITGTLSSQADLQTALDAKLDDSQASAFGLSLLDDANAATARATLGVVVGTDVQAHDATLSSLSALGTAADKTVYTTGVDTWAETPLTAFARTLLDDANVAAAKTTLGLTIGADVQAWAANLDSWSSLAPAAKQDSDATLTALAGVATASDQIIYATGSDTFATSGLTAFARTLLDDADAPTARATLGLAIGTDVQAYDAELAALAGLTSAADALPYFTGSGSASTTTLTSFARTLLDDANQGAMRTTLGLVPGTDVQAYDALLLSIAGLTFSADSFIYGTGSDTAAAGTITTFGRSLVDDADASTARTTLGLGSLATANTINGGNWSGTDLALADGGTGASLTDPGADRVMFWDDSAGQVTWLTIGTGLAITGTTLDSTSSGGDALTSNPLSQFASTTSAQLAGVLSDETGSGGKAMFSAGPTLDAGTTSIPAMAFTSGSNLTTASAGSWEFDGVKPMFTPLGTQRGIVPAKQFFRLNAGLAGSNATGAQNIFGKSVTVTGSTIYAFRLMVILNKTAGTTSHTITYSIGGTATINDLQWGGIITSNASALPTALAQVGISTSVTLNASSAITTAAWNSTAQLQGIINVNAGGTLNWNYALSAAPGGAYTTVAGAWVEIWPIGASGANISVGTWA